MDENYVLRIRSFIDKNGIFIFKNPNITAMGLGNKIIDGVDTGIPTLTFIVNKKVNVNSLNSKQIIPKWINGVLTDVIESDDRKESKRIKENARPEKAGDPAIGGAVVSREGDGGVGGVIAYAVTERRKRIGLYLLSNQHVLAKDFTKDASVNKGVKIYFPRISISKGDPRAMIGVYSKGTAIKPGTPIFAKAYNELDAAIAWIGPNNDANKKKSLKVGLGFNQEIIKITGTAIAKAGDEIYNINYDNNKKVLARVIATGATVKVKILDKETAFKNQIITTGSYDEEDSGRLGMIDRDNKDKAFGMIMCGEKGFKDIAYKTYYNPIDRILEELDIEFVTD